MKIKKNLIACLLSVFLLSSLIGPAFAVEKNQDEMPCRILFTSDLHSNLLPYTVMDENGKISKEGGFARIATLIRENKNENTFLVDSGDFSMGSLFNCLFETAAPELNLMANMGYDATTLGNHDFDYGLSALANDLNAASENANHPTIVASNMVYGDDEASKTLEKAMQHYGASETKIIAKNGIKVGVFGLLGVDAQHFTNNESLTFKDIEETAAHCVETLRQQGADMILCLSHAGTNADSKKSEDEILAQNVEGIDVIISGHTHATLNKPLQINDTLIVSVGANTQNLGVLDLVITPDGKVNLNDYSLKAATSDVEEDETMNQMINGYKKLVEDQYLSKLGKNFDDVVVNSAFTTEAGALTFGNHNISDLIADAYMYEAEQNNIDADFSMITAGLIRDAVYTGDNTESDIFRILSLGQADDGSPGYALVDAYITGEAVNTLCQIDVIADLVMPEAHMGFSRLRYTYNNDRLPLDKVTGVEIQDAAGIWQPVEKDKKYHVITSQYNADMIATISSLTKGIIQIPIYDQAGNEVTDTNQLISKKANGSSLQEWAALSDYCHSFAKNEAGVSVLPESYAKARATKTEDTATGFFEKTSHYGKMIYAALIMAVVVLIFIIFVIVLIIKRIRRSKKQKNTGNNLGSKL